MPICAIKFILIKDNLFLVNNNIQRWFFNVDFGIKTRFTPLCIVRTSRNVETHQIQGRYELLLLYQEIRW